MPLFIVLVFIRVRQLDLNRIGLDKEEGGLVRLGNKVLEKAEVV